MKKSTVEAIRKGDMINTIKSMIETQYHYNYSVVPYTFSIDDERNDGVVYEDLLVKTDMYIKKLCTLDKIAIEVNEILYELEESKKEFSQEEFIQYLEKEKKYEIATDGSYCEAYGSWYTYNDGDYNRLDRDIACTLFDIGEDKYILIAVHYGADARIGFGDMVCFRMNDCEINNIALAMEIKAYDRETDEDYEYHQVEDVATYNKETDEWVINGTDRVLGIYSAIQEL